MTLRLASAAALIAAVSACTPIVVTRPVPAPAPAPVIVRPAPVTTTSPLTGAVRATATAVVNREMAKRLPGVNVAPYTACVVNNATMAEIVDLGSLAVGNDAAAATAVAAIVRRPSTTQCIAGVARTA